MALYHEGWKTGEEKAKTAKIVRSLAQDQGRHFKKNIVRSIYPEKMVDDKDIGLICTEWTYRVLTSFSFDKELLQRLMAMIYFAYKQGKNLDTDPLWKLHLIYKVLPSFSEKIDVFPVIAKLSLMGDLEKPKKKSSGYGNVRW